MRTGFAADAWIARGSGAVVYTRLAFCLSVIAVGRLRHPPREEAAPGTVDAPGKHAGADPQSER